MTGLEILELLFRGALSAVVAVFIFLGLSLLFPKLTSNENAQVYESETVKHVLETLASLTNVCDSMQKRLAEMEKRLNEIDPEQGRG